jgi:hypothetical protein
MATLRACATLVLLAAGCGPETQASRPWTGASFAQDRIVEMGPLLVDEAQPVDPPAAALHGKLPGFRLESFGGTVLDIDLWGTHPVLFVQGPLQGPDGDDPGPAPLVAEAAAPYDAGAHLVGVRLTTPGVYRVVVADRTALASGGPLLKPLMLTARCTSGFACERPFLPSPPAELLNAHAALALVASYVTGDPLTFSRLWHTPTGQLHYAQAIATIAAEHKFTTFPQANVGSLSLSTFLNVSDLDYDAPVPEPVMGDLTDLLGACDVPRAHPIPVSGPFSAGQFPDRSLTRCQVAGSVRLAATLSSLALHEAATPLHSPAHVSYRGRTYENVPQLISALLDAGHRIELFEERTVVPAVSISYEGKEIFWPVWMNTGLVLEGGTSLRMPATRSRIVWRISGPEVNARIALGSKKGGAWFVPQLDRPAGWVGRRATEVATDPGRVVESFRVAAHYMTRDGNRLQIPRLPPAFGTSSDAAAALRRCLLPATDATLPFPLLRSRQADQLLAPSNLRDPIERQLQDMPHDYDDWKTEGWSTDSGTNRDGLRRLYNMMPFATDSPTLDLFSPLARRGACLLERNIGKPASPACRSIMTKADLR